MIGLCTERQPTTCMYHEDRPASFVPDVGYLCETCTDSYVGEGTMVNAGEIEIKLGKMEKILTSGEPTFLLRAQDISAHLAVELWISAQRTIKSMMDDGATMTEAVEHVREYHKIPRLAVLGPSLNDKEMGARSIASAMMQWNKRKLAD